MNKKWYCHIMVQVLLITSVAVSGKEGFFLESEVMTSYEGGVSKVCTWYTYNNDSHLYQLRHFAGADTTAPLSERIVYTYNSSGAPLCETYIADTDTTKRFMYFYNAENNCVSIQKLNSEGGLSYSDSFFYKESNATKRTRYSSNGTVLFYNQYTYNGDLLVSDSAFHPDGASTTFTPQEIITYDYTADKIKKHETVWTLTGGRFSAKTTTYSYSDNNLTSEVTRTGTATSGLFTDSLSYQYDTKGNCIHKSHFIYGDTLTLISSVDYTWKSTSTQLALLPVKNVHPVSVSLVENSIIISGNEVSNARFRITDISGRVMLFTRITLGNSVILKPLTLASGKYFLFVRIENGETVIPLMR